jgi:hydrogenase nickel incorporation protein HypB
MCEECGCGLPGEKPVGIHAHEAEHDHAHAHEHAEGHEHEHGHEHVHDHEHGPGLHHGHEHGEPHAHPHAHRHVHAHSHEAAGGGQAEPAAARGRDARATGTRRTLEVRQAILARNDRLAERNRGFFRARGLLVLNLVSAPGSGKTTFLQQTLRGLGPQLKAGVIVGDLATDNDARRLRESGAPVVQITTGTVCHLEAQMVARAVAKVDLEGLALLFIENVGNLVCPAAYDLGEDLRVVLLSVTEGEDKPLKYPPLFQSANVVVVSKVDLAQACGFDAELARANLARVAPGARIFETSARTGRGMEGWLEFLSQQRAARQARGPLD